MMENYYNILWADDEIESLLTEETLDLLDAYKLRVVYKADNSGDARKYLDKHPFYVDAVITDANYGSMSGRQVTSERNMQGLIDIINLAERYSQRIPFFLYTQRDKSLIVNENMLADEQVSCFTTEGRWFMKSDDKDEFFDKIRHDIEKVNSPQSQIRNIYAKEFEAARLFPDAEQLLAESLLFEYTSDANTESTYKFFNPIRMIFENIVDGLKEHKYLPKLKSLNSVPDFLNQREVEGFVLNKPIMSRTLIHSLDYFLDVTQDGSHSNKDLSLGVIDYVRSRRNSNLYKSVLHIIMDVLLWYKELIDNTIDVNNLWTGTYEAEGKICVKMNKGRTKYILNGMYELEYKGDLEDGMEVGIIKSIPSKFPFENVKKYVYNSNIIKK